MNDSFDARGKIFTKVISKMAVGVIIQTTKQIIHGNIHVMPEERLSDELNREGNYLPVTNAIVYNNEGKVLYEGNFLSINRTQIIWIIPVSELLEVGPK
jgi:hypothetical protein